MTANYKSVAKNRVIGVYHTVLQNHHSKNIQNVLDGLCTSTTRPLFSALSSLKSPIVSPKYPNDLRIALYISQAQAIAPPAGRTND